MIALQLTPPSQDNRELILLENGGRVTPTIKAGWPRLLPLDVPSCDDGPQMTAIRLARLRAAVSHMICGDYGMSDCGTIEGAEEDKATCRPERVVL